MRYTYIMQVQITTDCTDPKLLEREAEQEIENFEKWFMTLGNTGRLTTPESAILKTYLGWKLGVYKKRG